MILASRVELFFLDFDVDSFKLLPKQPMALKIDSSTNQNRQWIWNAKCKQKHD